MPGLKPHHAHFAALGRQRDLAFAQPQRIVAKGLAPPALQRLNLARARGDPA